MRTAIALVLLAASGAVSAKGFTTGSHVDAYYSDADLKVDGPGDADGDGGGLSLWMGNGVGLFTVELQKNKLDVDHVDADIDARQYRLGLGYRFINEPAVGAWLRVEYARLETDLDPGDSDDQDGYGAHFGAMIGSHMFNGYAEIGLIELEDTDGLEYRVGVAFQPSMFGGFVEYRATNLELDADGSDFDIQDLRVGVRFAY